MRSLRDSKKLLESIWEMDENVIELKKDKNAKAAIDRIKQMHYVKALEGYKGNQLLTGIFKMNLKQILNNESFSLCYTKSVCV